MEGCNTCLEQLREQADEELFLFLEEWFDDRSYVLGHTSLVDRCS